VSVLDGVEDRGRDFHLVIRNWWLEPEALKGENNAVKGDGIGSGNIGESLLYQYCSPGTGDLSLNCHVKKREAMW
jgi:hypothetical protein